MDELVNTLADLQTERAARENAADKESAAIDLMIQLAEDDLNKLREDRRIERKVDEIAMGELDVAIENVSAQIINTWNGEKKTMVFDAGTLKFRTSQSLKITDPTLTLVGLLQHTSDEDVATKYIKGFNLTAVKKYMGVLSLPTGAAQIDRKTTVKLETM